MPMSPMPRLDAARAPSSALRLPTPDSGIVGAVGFALDALADPTVPHPTVSDGRLELMLRAASGWSRLRTPGQDTPAVARAAVAVRVACAYLAADDLAEARLALSGAQDHLGTRPSTALPAPTPPLGAQGPLTDVDRVPAPDRMPSAVAARRSPAA